MGTFYKEQVLVVIAVTIRMVKLFGRAQFNTSTKYYK